MDVIPTPFIEQKGKAMTEQAAIEALDTMYARVYLCDNHEDREKEAHKHDYKTILAALQSKVVEVEEILTKMRDYIDDRKDFSMQPHETAKDAYIYHLYKIAAKGYFNTPQWQPIETAPRNKNIMLMPICGIPFSGDIWNCKNRNDIEEDELIRIRCPDGHIFSTPITWATHWQDLPSWDSLIPQPQEGENE